MKKRGFTIAELIIVIAIISIMGTVLMSTYAGIRKAGDTQKAATLYANILKEAVRKSEVMEQDTPWGVYISSTSTTLFSGTSYALRTPARDSVYVIPSNVSISGPTEVVFGKFTGNPSVTGTTTFSNGFGTSSVYIWTGGVIGN